MKLCLIFTLIFLLCGCENNKIERGQTLSQLKNEVNKSEAVYLNEMSLIFSDYSLKLYDLQLIRSDAFFYFVDDKSDFDLNFYENNVKKKILKNGWVMVENNSFGELFFNEDSQAIGVTFPTQDKKLVGVNKGYFTYQFYNKIAVTLYYTSDRGSVICNNKKEKLNNYSF